MGCNKCFSRLFFPSSLLDIFATCVLRAVWGGVADIQEKQVANAESDAQSSKDHHRFPLQTVMINDPAKKLKFRPTGFAKSSKLTALNTPVVLAPLRPSPGSGAEEEEGLPSDMSHYVR